MKTGIHHKYTMQSFTCSCGNIIQVNSTVPGQGIEICSNCHPFYTGKQKLLDSAGRIEKFNQRYTSVVGGARKSRNVKEAKEPVKAASKEAPTKAAAKASKEPAKSAKGAPKETASA